MSLIKNIYYTTFSTIGKMSSTAKQGFMVGWNTPYIPVEVPEEEVVVTDDGTEGVFTEQERWVTKEV